MLIIVGLGNPGGKYTYTRHNAGFLSLEILAKRHNIELKKSAHKAVIGEGRIDSEKVVLAMPQTFMNLSGESVVSLINWYKIDPAEELVVLYDDIDLPVGDIRVRAKGSAGTHNGMRSIIYLTGTDEFARVRIGVGACKPGWDLANYVLSTFDEEEKKPAYEALEHAADAVELMVKEGLPAAQQAFNKKKKKPGKEEKIEKQECAQQPPPERRGPKNEKDSFLGRLFKR